MQVNTMVDTLSLGIRKQPEKTTPTSTLLVPHFFRPIHCSRAKGARTVKVGMINPGKSLMIVSQKLSLQGLECIQQPAFLLIEQYPMIWNWMFTSKYKDIIATVAIPLSDTKSYLLDRCSALA